MLLIGNIYLKFIGLRVQMSFKIEINVFFQKIS